MMFKAVLSGAGNAWPAAGARAARPTRGSVAASSPREMRVSRDVLTERVTLSRRP